MIATFFVERTGHRGSLGSTDSWHNNDAYFVDFHSMRDYRRFTHALRRYLGNPQINEYTQSEKTGILISGLKKYRQLRENQYYDINLDVLGILLDRGLCNIHRIGNSLSYGYELVFQEYNSEIIESLDIIHRVYEEDIDDGEAWFKDVKDIDFHLKVLEDLGTNEIRRIYAEKSNIDPLIRKSDKKAIRVDYPSLDKERLRALLDQSCFIEELVVHDVNQGNWNSLINQSQNVVIAYDLGTTLNASDSDVQLIKNTIIPKYSYDKSKPILIISHWDKDHYHCLLKMTCNEISNTFRAVICPNILPSATAKREFSRLSSIMGQDFYPIDNLKCLPKGFNKKLHHIHPLIHWSNNYHLCVGTATSDINKAGIQLVLLDHTNAILTGDCSGQQVIDIVREPNYRICFMRQGTHIVVPHHGSGKDIKEAKGWSLGIIRPEEALISVNEKMNNYGHPDPDLISLLVAHGFNVNRTDIEGDLIVHL